MLLLGLAGAGAAAARPRPPGTSHALARRAAEDYLSRPDFMPYRSGDVTGVHYAEIASAYGVARLAAASSDRPLLDRLRARYRRMVEAALPNSANHVDVSVYGVLPLELARQTGDAEARTAGLELAEGQWRETGADGLTLQARYWIDDVWMIGMLQTQAWRATSDARYLDRAALMARLYIARLQQPNGLFHHGPKAPFFWGRGNGWVAAGLAEILSELPRNHADFAPIFAGYRKMMAALLPHQASSGMWRQLIDRPEAWEESSATAMFAYAFALGRRIRLLEDGAYGRAARRAWGALDAKTGADGKLSAICVGTGQSADAAYYLARPAVTGDLHGQAALLWLASEMVR
jgi:rhamnogalacturonyl hydrolase YesR